MLDRVKQDGDCHPSLTRNCIYYVLGIESDTYRLINDHGDPCLYEPEMFEVVDPREPEDWVTTMGEEGERYAYPLPLNRMGFFEDYHDRDNRAITEFWQHVNRLMAAVDRNDEIGTRTGSRLRVCIDYDYEKRARGESGRAS